MKSKRKHIKVIDQTEEYGEFISRETHKLLKTITGTTGSNRKILSAKFLKDFTKRLVLDSLMEHTTKSLSEQEAFTLTKQSFSDIKSSIQQEISAGFEDAFYEYTGRKVEYYCQILPVPEAINKEMC